nr:hypothetical protein [Tanacetum cinerariifolium]
MNQQREHEALLAAQRKQELREQEQAAQEKEETPQSSDFHQLIREIYGTKVCEEQKKNMEDTMLELLEDCRQKELYCMHNDEVKNIVEQAPERKTHLTKCLENFKVIHKKSFISLNNTSQIYSVIAIAPVLPTEEPEYSLNTLIDSSPKFDYLLEEFSGELAYIDPIPPVIKESDFDLEEEIRLVENLLYDISSPRLPKELNVEINDTILKSLSPSPIPVEDSDSLMEEIDSFLDTDDLMPPGIENDDYDSEGDIHFLKELLSNDTLTLPKNELSNFDHHDDPSFPRPLSKPSDVEVLFDLEPDTGVLAAKVVEDISEYHVLMLKVLPIQPALCLNIDPLLQFSSENVDKVFKPSILSYLLVSHRDKIILIFLRTRS